MSENYEEKIRELLERNLTDKAYSFWVIVNKTIPKVWDKLSSSSKKYHKDENGDVQSIGRHTYEMLASLEKIISVFNNKPKTEGGDALFLACAFHDMRKYGSDGGLTHTIKEHDKLIGDTILYNKVNLSKIMDNKSYSILEEAVRFHSGRWSTDWNDSTNFNTLNPETLLIHILDMLSSRNCLKI